MTDETETVVELKSTITIHGLPPSWPKVYPGVAAAINYIPPGAEGQIKDDRPYRRPQRTYEEFKRSLKPDA